MFIMYLGLGILAGILSGMLGVGGGIVVVPGLTILFKKFAIIPADQIMRMAVGTSFVIMTFTTSASAFVHIRRKLVIWSLFWRIMPYVCLGLIAGIILEHYLSNHQLQVGFALFLMLMASYLFYQPKLVKQHRSVRTRYTHFVFVLVCAAVGMLAGFFGIGGSTLLVPYLLYLGTRMHQATGTAVTCVVPMSILGTLGFMFFVNPVHVQTSQVPLATGFIYWPAVLLITPFSVFCVSIGVRLSAICSEYWLKRIFALVMILTGVYLL